MEPGTLLRHRKSARAFREKQAFDRTFPRYADAMQQPVAPGILGAALLGCGGATASATGSPGGSRGAGVAVDQREHER